MLLTLTSVMPHTALSSFYVLIDFDNCLKGRSEKACTPFPLKSLEVKIYP